MSYKHFSLTTVGSLLTDFDQFIQDGFGAEFEALQSKMAAIYSPDVSILVSDMEQNGWYIDHVMCSWHTIHSGESDQGRWMLEEMFTQSDGVIGWCLSIGGSEGNSALSTYFLVM